MRSAVPSRGRVRQAGLLLLPLAAFSCASPASKILTSANGYHWHSARYEETCRSQPVPQDCPSRADVLRRWYTALDEANAALQRGGKLPLQLDALKSVEKEAKGWTK